MEHQISEKIIREQVLREVHDIPNQAEREGGLAPILEQDDEESDGFLSPEANRLLNIPHEIQTPSTNVSRKEKEKKSSQEIGDKIREKISSLNLPPEIALRAEWTLRQIINRETKQGKEDLIKTREKKTYTVDNLLDQIQTAEHIGHLINTESEYVLRKSEWSMGDSSQLEDWISGKQTPDFMEEGEFLAVARVTNMISKKEIDADFYYRRGTTLSKLPLGPVGEVKYYQLIKKGQPLKEVSQKQSVSDSSDTLAKYMRGEGPTDASTEMNPEPWENIKIDRKTTSEDRTIAVGQLFVYDGLSLNGNDSGLFQGKVLGLNKTGDVVVETLSDPKQVFAIDRGRWNDSKKIKNQSLKFAETPEQMQEIFLEAQEKQRQTLEIITKTKEEHPELFDTMYYEFFRKNIFDLTSNNSPASPEAIAELLIEDCKRKLNLQEADLITLKKTLLETLPELKNPNLDSKIKSSLIEALIGEIKKYT